MTTASQTSYRSWLVVLAVCTLLSVPLMLLPAGMAAAATTTEPSWPSRCPLKVGLLLDRSSSMAPTFKTVRSSASDLVDALRDQPSQVVVVGFGTKADVV